MLKPISRAILLSVALILSVSTLFYLKKNFSSETINVEEKTEKGEEERESGADRQMEMIWQARAYPDPNYINDKFLQAWQHAQAMKKSQIYKHGEILGSRNGSNSTGSVNEVNYGSWTSTGPIPTVGGRILSIAINPSNTNIIFIGSASGGIWKTTTGGTGANAWQPVNINWPVLGVPTIIINPTNPNIIYAGTGEVYRVDTSNIGYNVWKARGSYGIGIIKSTDGGVTWDTIFNKTLPQLFGIQMLKFNPLNSNTIYACATDGLYRSRDAGENWTQILSKTYVSDVVINSSDTTEIMAAVGNLVNPDKGIYRTTNGGTSWTKVVDPAIPVSFSGFTRFGYLSGDTVLAAISRDDVATQDELFRSTNFGATWTAKTSSHHAEFQFWFAHAIAVNPSKPDSVILGGVGLYRYRQTPQTLTDIQGVVHSDIHDIEFDPNNSDIFYVACDGGMYKTTNGGAGFSTINNGLAATQFYASIGVSALTPNLFIGGLQDNGVWRYNGTTWTNVLGGDGGPCIINPSNDNIVFASRDARNLSRSSTGVTGAFGAALSSWAFVADDRTAFMAPIAISKSTPATIYAASDNLHKSTTNGTSGSWTNPNYSTATNYIEARYKTGIALAVSPTNANKLFVSTSPFSQRVDNNLNIVGLPNVLRSTNGGTSFTSIKAGLPDRFVLDFAISPTYDDSMFVVLGGFGTSHVYVTGNGGNTWTSRGAGLPDVPFNAIVFDPTNSNIIYAGSDLGVYVSINRGATWWDFNTGLSDVTMVFDLQVSADNKLVAATHGRGVYTSALVVAGSVPVNILEFNGTNKNYYNEIKWKVSEENGVSHYELQRSLDGNTFNTIASIPSHNSNSVTTYTYNDAVDGSNPVLYYRLKTVDVDRTFAYSGVILIKVPYGGRLEILGNPFTDHITVKLPISTPQRVSFRLFDAKGKLMKVEDMNASAGINRYSINKLNNLPAGTYLLEVITQQGRFSQRLVKK